MGKQVYSPELDGPLELKDPLVAAFLAWLWPGLGHLYQGRVGKGLLLMVCVLGLFLYGLLALGDGRTVFAAWQASYRRLPYVAQLGVGLPALPALVQASRKQSGKPYLFGGVMAPPRLPGEPLPVAGPGNQGPVASESLDDLHRRLHRYFELGTVYTMIAGLLNVLAIYDALAGPAYYDDRRRPLPDEVPPK